MIAKLENPLHSVPVILPAAHRIDMPERNPETVELFDDRLHVLLDVRAHPRKEPVGEECDIRTRRDQVRSIPGSFCRFRMHN